MAVQTVLKKHGGEENWELRPPMNQAGDKERRCYEPQISKNPFSGPQRMNVADPISSIWNVEGLIPHGNRASRQRQISLKPAGRDRIQRIS